MFPLFLCAYKIRGEDHSIHGPKKKTREPVFEYTPEQMPVASVEAQYSEYYLLTITSLLDARENLDNNQIWARRMIDTAYRYLDLLSMFFSEDHQDVFSLLSEEIKQVNDILGKGNLSSIKQKKIARQLENIANQLKKEFSYSQVKEWTKQ